MECRLDSVTVNYEVYGSGRPILMLHGFSVDHRVMKGAMEPLFTDRSGWQRIYIDLPGMGKTPGREWIRGTDEMLAVIEQFIDAVLPGQRFLLAGNSYGGYLAQGLLAKRPDLVAGMLLIVPVVEPEAGKRILPAPAVLTQDKAFLATLPTDQADVFTSTAVVQERQVWERLQAEVLAGVELADPASLQRVKESYSLTFPHQPYGRPYEEPVLILVGRQDAVVGYRDQWRMLEHYPRASFAVLDRAGHILQIEQSRLFTALVSEWLDRVEERKTSGQ